MPLAKTKSSKRTGNGQTTPTTLTHEPAEVLTPAEAAVYLRVSEADVLSMTNHPGFPARRVGNEWRFLKSALHDWLQNAPPRPSREAVLASIGSWKDDPYLEKMLKEIEKQRGRQTAEEGD